MMRSPKDRFSSFVAQVGFAINFRTGGDLRGPSRVVIFKLVLGVILLSNEFLTWSPTPVSKLVNGGCCVWSRNGELGALPSDPAMAHRCTLPA